MAEISGFRARNVAVMAVGAGCVVAVDGLGRRYEDLAPPENATVICWDHGEGLIRRRDCGTKPFTSFDILAPYLERWARDQAAEDEAAAAEAKRALDRARAAQAASEAALASFVDRRIEAKNG